MIRRKQTSSRLRQRLTLQEKVQTSDTGGGYTRSWQDIAELWAEIIPVSGREKFFAEQLESSITHRVLLRYRDDITAGQRLVFESRAFNIQYVSESDPNREVIELLVEEGAAA